MYSLTYFHLFYVTAADGSSLNTSEANTSLILPNTTLLSSYSTPLGDLNVTSRPYASAAVEFWEYVDIFKFL